MKNTVLSLFVAFCCLVAVAQSQAATSEKFPWMDMQEACINKVKWQIQNEIDASMTYLAMGAHFSRDTVNLPGFANFFFESAREEREHGHKLIEYLLMRGELIHSQELKPLITIQVPSKDTWTSGLEALNDALAKETFVTKAIREVIATCESTEVPCNEKGCEGKTYNDYHLVDYLTGVYLEEQYAGQRALAGKIATLKKMTNKQNGKMAEFLFDKKISD